MTETQQPRIGRLAMSGKDTNLSMWCGALAFNPALSGYELMVLSVAGPSSTLKAVQAALSSRAKIQFTTEDIPGMRPHWKMFRHASQYRTYRHRMGYNTWHLLAVSKHAGLLTDTSDESIWRALQCDSITTPLLRRWVPHIRAELDARGYLTLLRSFGCRAAILTATVDDVDRIVSDGIRIGALRLEDEQ